MAEFMLQKIMGEIFLPTSRALDVERQGKSIMTISRDPTKRVRLADGDQYNLLPSRDVSDRVTGGFLGFSTLNFPLTTPPLRASGRHWEQSFLT